MLFPLFLLFLFRTAPCLAADAPVTTAATITNAGKTAGGTSVPLIVTGFNDIGGFTLTLRFNITRALYVGASPNPALSGMSVVYTPPATGSVGKIVLSWTGAANVSLPDSAHLADLSFTYLYGTADLVWGYTSGNVCSYQTWSGGSLTTLNDLPKTSYYINGAISERTAPVTSVADLGNPAAGPLVIPVTVSGFDNIGAITLTLEYDPAVLTYQNSFSANPAFTSNFLVGNQPSADGLMKIRIQWFGTGPGVDLADGSVICNLNFSYIGGGAFTKLQWLEDGSSCQYADSGSVVLIDWPEEEFYTSGQVGVRTVDIGIREHDSCGSFSVNLHTPYILREELTRLVFTVQWPALAGSDVQIINIVPLWPGLAQVGNRVLYNGSYYVTFASVSAWEVDWAAASTHDVMHFNITANGEGNAPFSIISSDYSTNPPGVNTAFQIEVNGSDATGSISNDATNAWLNCGVHLRTLLQGAYDTTVKRMRTVLVANGLLPATQPYGKAPWNYDGKESCASFPSDITDWVLVELRQGTGANTAVTRRAALLRSDGTIVDTNGASRLVFYDMEAGLDYYVVVYHRNHMPVMSGTAVTLPNLPATSHDFTSNTVSNVYSVTADGVIRLSGNVYGQICGDLNHDNLIRYSGSGNDRASILNKINSLYATPPAFLTSVIEGYHKEDLNLDKIVKYSGPQNDQALIIQSIYSFNNPAYLTSIYVGQVPVNFSLTK